MFWLYLSGAIFLVLFGGLVAGLTLGLMSLDQTNLHILATSGDEKQKKYAARIQPIRENGHLLLVTLLLTNTLVNETLPILFDSLFGGGGFTAILVSTGLIVLFGEIIPQSVCSRHGLRVGAFFAWPVRILIWIMWIIAYPIACLLDWILGEHHGVIYRRAELRELVSLHESTQGGSLTHDEVTIIQGALDLSGKTVKEVMTPMKYVFSLSFESRLDRKTMTDILRAGHSRVPIYKETPNNIVGVLLVKNLILLNPEDAVPISEVKIFDSPKVCLEESLFDLLNRFQEGGSHMAQVVDPSSPSSPIGIITLEDVLEEIIQEEIVDETDVFVDVAKKIRVIRAMNPRIRRRSTMDGQNGPNTSTTNQKSDLLVPGENKKWPKGLSFSSKRNDVPEHLKNKNPGLPRSNSSGGCDEHRELLEQPNERTALLGTSV
ncbi:DUF21-domain-containing protein [Basidiobolus meristosporus CBS 931.73]|uniref:DUF21-domain-containing protein n=1 Tax=Basidiobolus meristosporus CBS 931.73 TaxID=1314790 RepID=A0A1Y1X613_9FUNG|nr:DUF21-domain-containing protein [Basidiobolus meristosporus CBS 931.73]|eukprot:ORX81142.1 DUF21-domain-containing protein [Basidiobolus meristosporus CBS 931.73]